MKLYFALLCAFLFLIPISQADDPSDEQRTITNAETALQSTVVIKPDALSEGSGFYVGKNTILTSYHVVTGPETVRIETFDGRKCTGRVGYREETPVDLALIRTDCTGTPLLVSSQQPHVGQTTLVVGNPLDVDFTVYKGIMSNVRNLDYLQLDSAMAPGNSGGPVIASDSTVIGVMQLKLNASDRIGWAISARQITRFLQRSGERL